MWPKGAVRACLLYRTNAPCICFLPCWCLLIYVITYTYWSVSSHTYIDLCHRILIYVITYTYWSVITYTYWSMSSHTHIDLCHHIHILIYVITYTRTLFALWWHGSGRHEKPYRDLLLFVSLFISRFLSAMQVVQCRIRRQWRVMQREGAIRRAVSSGPL